MHEQVCGLRKQAKPLELETAGLKRTIKEREGPTQCKLYFSKVNPHPVGIGYYSVSLKYSTVKQVIGIFNNLLLTERQFSRSDEDSYTVERVPPAPIVDPMHFVNRARTLAAEHTADPNGPGLHRGWTQRSIGRDMQHSSGKVHS